MAKLHQFPKRFHPLGLSESREGRRDAPWLCGPPAKAVDGNERGTYWYPAEGASSRRRGWKDGAKEDIPNSHLLNRKRDGPIISAPPIAIPWIVVSLPFFIIFYCINARLEGDTEASLVKLFINLTQICSEEKSWHGSKPLPSDMVWE